MTLEPSQTEGPHQSWVKAALATCKPLPTESKSNLPQGQDKGRIKYKRHPPQMVTTQTAQCCSLRLHPGSERPQQEKTSQRSPTNLSCLREGTSLAQNNAPAGDGKVTRGQCHGEAGWAAGLYPNTNCTNWELTNWPYVL